MSDPIYEAQAYEIAKMARSISALEAENTKLRELAHDYDRAMASTHALCDSDFALLNDATLLALRSRMYKLGIEVDNAS